MADSAIPVIDLCQPSPETAQQVLSAASTHGFLFIKNDGITIPPADIDAMFTLSKQFFSSAVSHKQQFAIHTPSAGGINRGWVRMSGEALDASHSDPKEAFNIGPARPDLQPLPHPLCDAQELILRFQQSCHRLCLSILTLLGTALQMPDESYFAARHDQTKGPSGTIFRLLYYPPSTTTDARSTQAMNDQVHVRAGPHSDYGSLTLLFRLPGQPGLQLLTPSNAWVDVPVCPLHYHHDSPSEPPPILVNIGDLLCYWTAGLLKSTIHRVTFSGGEERLSMAYFCHPLDDAVLQRVPGRVMDEWGDQGRDELERQCERLGLGRDDKAEITAKEHLDRRLRVTYGL
ncbi:hypothetical protein ACEQ8H_006534 [Pleosporales sp. CAS-2024a]